mmetsp:Transcript_65855/g.146298  ORF Transcript_65855/g.146298 Transcript_65855/m.146298 type:complete len:513 (-) Transcript_65855:73-1611(-)
MPRPIKIDDPPGDEPPGPGPSPGQICKALQVVRDHQERSLHAIEALLRSIEEPTAGPPVSPEGSRRMSMGYKLFEAPSTVTDEDASKNAPKTRQANAGSLHGSKFGNLMSEDDDKKETNAHSPGAWCRWILNKPQFDWVMGIIIFMNSIAIGIDTEKSIQQGDLLPSWPSEELDVAFIVVYVIEIAMRLTAYGRVCFKDQWFLFDVFLVGMGIFGNIMTPILGSATSGGASEVFSMILVVRSLRLLRLVRAIRMLHMFRTVWRLVYGLLTSGNAILSTFFILLLTLYIFACLGVELIGKDEDLKDHDTTKHVVAYHFSSLPRTLLTLMAFVAADSISSVYSPICVLKPYLIMYFVPILLIVSVSLMNLVTAVLVEGALANAANDKELSRHDMKQTVKKWAPKIMEVFSAIDEDGNGTLERHELSKIQLSDLPFEVSLEQVDSLEDLFDMLDVEGRGELSQGEFADGLLNLLTNDMPIHQMKTFKMLQINSVTLERLESKVGQLERKLNDKKR